MAHENETRRQSKRPELPANEQALDRLIGHARALKKAYRAAREFPEYAATFAPNRDAAIAALKAELPNLK